MTRKYKPKPWEKAAQWRRILLLVIIVVTTAIASSYMAALLPRRGGTPLEIAVVTCFAILFAWISIGFWAATVGFFTLLRRYDRYAVSTTCSSDQNKLGADARTAILMPVYNEEIHRVLAGLCATYKSLEETGQLELFDFFLLSDTNDPDLLIEEEVAWFELLLSAEQYKIFFRSRKVNLKRKSGNIADFCRRWGRNYRYMIVLDADSVMNGVTLVKMVQMMQQCPDIGILQTAPMAVNRQTLIARIQQFASHVYGPMFAAGLHFWQLGDSQYWGHNAIIRIQPFMKHCSLPQLPGNPPLGGDILSHDFVEAALMRRAGWEIWLAYDLAGSYEEVPPTLLEELKRDRRWCQGNLQHMRLLFTKGLFPAHRALFLNGAMSYMSALLWFLFLCLSTAEALIDALWVPKYFPEKHVLFPHWPVWHKEWALTLLASTGVILFLPKLFSVILIVLKGRTRLFGGFPKLILSIIVEIILSTLLAPIRMLFHSKFVFITLLGQKIGWGPQQRDDRGTGWLEAIRFHGFGMVFALLWGTAMFWVSRSFFLWLLPILTALLVSIPVSVWTSRISLGRFSKRLGLFLIPEEVAPPPELQRLHNALEMPQPAKSPLAAGREEGFIRAVVDPYVNSLHLSLLPPERKLSARIVEHRQNLRQKALTRGPDSLTAAEKKELLLDPASMRALHEAVWELADETLADRWSLRANAMNS